MDLSVLALSIVKQGDKDLPGLTDTVHPKRLGPKRATKIRRFFGLSKEDDVSNPIGFAGLFIRAESDTPIHYRFASSSFVVKWPPRRRAQSHTQRQRKFNASLPLNVYNTNVTG
jgi:hypothetical protein